ncbi:MAG: hypothetical protein ACJAVR_001722 [Paracoccaceae bacterium]|jgi:hypothetical protein
MFEFTCSDCFEVHKGAPSFAFAQPAEAHILPPADHAERVELSGELCIIRPDDENPFGEAMYFIRADLAIPIYGEQRPFTWGVWAEVAEDDFYEHVDASGEDRRGAACRGMLAVTLPDYDEREDDEDVAQLPCTLQWGAGARPKITLDDGDHPLATDQRDGIAQERAAMLATIMLHGRAEDGL